MDERGWWQRRSTAPADVGASDPDTGGAGDVDATAEAAPPRALDARRWAVYGGGVLATAVIIGGAAVIAQHSGGSGPSGATAPSAESAQPTVAPARPAPTERSQETGDGTVTAGNPFEAGDDTLDLMRDTDDFRFGLFALAAEHLDPEKRYLNYSTRSLQSGSDSTGHRTLGIKLGWKVPGEPGEGMVQIAVSDMTGPDRPTCGENLEMQCRPLALSDGESVEVGEADDGSYDVLYRRADGVSVHVRVDPLFGNNSLVPVEEMRIDRRDVYR